MSEGSFFVLFLFFTFEEAVKKAYDEQSARGWVRVRLGARVSRARVMV